jgi:antitoxin VapB
MGALYVKDDKANAMANQLAERRGLTKAAAVRLALSNELAKDAPKRSAREILDELQRTSTLTFDPDVVIDKAFYDSLYEDDEE